MALVVEDNTGLSTAESYASEAEFRAYWANRSVDVTTYTQSQVEAALRVATQYIDSNWYYRAVVLQTSQALEFPRVGLTDRSGRLFTGVPVRVKAACNEAAYQSITGQALYQVAERGGMVKTEGVGTISTTYSDDAPAGVLFEVIKNLLAPFVRDAARPYILGPVYIDNNPTFAVGEFDIPPSPPDPAT